MLKRRDIKGFTLVELLVALVVTSVILSAVATLAFAMNTASNAGEDSAYRQAQLRQTTLRLLDLIGGAKLVCAAPGDDLVVWRADTNGNEAIDVNEVVYVERGTDLDMLRLCSFETTGSHLVTLSDLTAADTKSWLVSNYDEQLTVLMSGCSNVQFTCWRDSAGDPLTRARQVTISVDLVEDSAVHHYEIDAALRARADHLLSSDGASLVSDDD
jgi:prepilin-type N-terminal cleavage/methylation domain-containing protein